MEIVKIVGNMCYVDEIQNHDLPFKAYPSLVGDYLNVRSRLLKRGYIQHESNRGVMFMDGNGEYAFFSDGEMCFCFSTFDTQTLIEKNWCTCHVMQYAGSMVASTV